MSAGKIFCGLASSNTYYQLWPALHANDSNPTKFNNHDASVKSELTGSLMIIGM